MSGCKHTSGESIGLGAPKGPKIEKIQSRLKFQSRSKRSIPIEIFNPGLSEFPTENRVLVDGSLEIFDLA